MGRKSYLRMFVMMIIIKFSEEIKIWFICCVCVSVREWLLFCTLDSTYVFYHLVILFVCWGLTGWIMGRYSLLRLCVAASVCVCVNEREIHQPPGTLSLKGWFACWLALVKGPTEMLWCGCVLPAVWLTHWINVVPQMKETQGMIWILWNEVSNIEHD